MNAEPIVTVLLPVYNGELYLREAIESILNQTYTNFTFLIINDGSTDNTEKIILSYHDERIKYVKNNQNLKLIKTLNKGFSLVHTKYVARMDADDISLPERLEKQVNYLEEHPDIGLLGTWCKSFGIYNEQITKYERYHEAIILKQLYQIQIVHPTCMLRMSVVDSLVNVYDENFLHAEDYELFTRLSHITKLANIPEVLHLYRKHSNAVSTLYNDIQTEASTRVQQREFSLLGYNSTPEQIIAYKLLNYQEYENIALPPSDVKIMLEQICIANKTSKYCNEQLLEKRMKQLWFGFCYETRQSIRMYNTFTLIKQRLSAIRYAKWIIKRIF